MRRKNPRPKRAVNARTVLKVSTGRREEGEEEGEEPLVLCLRFPDEVEGNHHHHQIQKEEEEEEEEMSVRKGAKRKRGHECEEEDSFSSFNGASSLSEFMESMDKRAAALLESKSSNVLPRKKRNTASEYVKNWKHVHAYIKSFVNHQTNLYATAEQRLVEVSQTDATKEYPLEHDKKYKHKWKTELCKLKQYLDKNDNATADKIKAIWSLESSLR